jgi:DNA primase
MDQVALIRDSIDVVALIGETVRLKNAGRNFKGLCPFHSEKTPSFMVSAERQMWHCFGCGKGGDCYSFLMEYERIEFPEALRTLAKRAGIALEQTPQAKQAASIREQIYQINSLVAEYYHYILTTHTAGKPAREYLQNRGIHEKTIATFKLGFAPAGGNPLSRYLVQRKKLERTLLAEAGVVFLKGAETVDFFRGRIIFPLSDHRENIVGFSGRILTENTESAKYINTKDTPVYHKRDHIFGINVTKDAIRKANQAILVEGEFDVLSMFQEGVSNAVAVKGTALTENQVTLLARFAQKVTMCFDGDRAGKEALKRSIPLLEKKGLTTTVIVLQDGKDPDEAIKKNAAGFKKAVREDSSVYEYLLTDALSQADSLTPEGKQQISDEILPLFATITNEIVKEHFLRKLSSALTTSYESISRELQRRIRREQPTHVRIPVKEKRTRQEVMEEYLMALILQHPLPKVASEDALLSLLPVLEEKRAYQKMLKALSVYFQQFEQFDVKRFLQTLPSEFQNAGNMSTLFPLPLFVDEAVHTVEILQTVRELKKLYVKEKLRDLTRAIKTQEDAGNEDEAAQLHKEYETWLSSFESLT